MKKKRFIKAIIASSILMFITFSLSGCSDEKKEESAQEVPETITEEVIAEDSKEEIIAKEEVTVEEEKVQEEETVFYWVSFVNTDGTVLQRTKYKKGDVPVYSGDTPSYADGVYNYIFNGWDKGLSKVNGNAVYTAVYTKIFIKLNPTVSAPEARNLTYNGKNQKLITAGQTNGGNIKYRLGDTGEYSFDIPVAKNAGTYTVWYKVFGDSTYNGTDETSVSVTIKKADWTVSVSDYAFKYDGNDHEAGVTVSGYEEPSVHYCVNSDEYSTTPKFKDVGIYEVSYSVLASSNYNSATGTYKVDISKVVYEISNGNGKVLTSNSLLSTESSAVSYVDPNAHNKVYAYNGFISSTSLSSGEDAVAFVSALNDAKVVPTESVKGTSGQWRLLNDEANCQLWATASNADNKNETEDDCQYAMSDYNTKFGGPYLLWISSDKIWRCYDAQIGPSEVSASNGFVVVWQSDVSATFLYNGKTEALNWEELKLTENGTKYSYNASVISDDTIGDSAFRYNQNLTNINIPDTVKVIGDHAFNCCNSSLKINLPKYLERIEAYAFSPMSTLNNITIPASTTYISPLAFSGCKNLKSISVNQDNTVYKSIGGVVFSKDGKTLMIYPYNGNSSYVIPDGVTRIATNALSAPSLTSITIPASVINIDKLAFCGSGLISATFANPNNWSVNYENETIALDANNLRDHAKAASYLKNINSDNGYTNQSWVRSVTTYNLKSSGGNGFVLTDDDLLATENSAIRYSDANGNIVYAYNGFISKTANSDWNDAVAFINLLNEKNIKPADLSKGASGRWRLLESSEDTTYWANKTEGEEKGFGSVKSIWSSESGGGGWRYCYEDNNYTEENVSNCIGYGFVAIWDTVIDVSDVTLNKTTIDLLPEGSKTLVPTISPSDATNCNVTWSSSDESVATVNSEGTVTAVNPGTATITVTTADSSKTATCTVNVLITFTYGDEGQNIYTYHALKNMIWEEFVNSSYNTNSDFSVSDDAVVHRGKWSVGIPYYGQVSKTSEIIDGQDYCYNKDPI